jgi:nucleotide-binding universal stress UspA family protein
VHTHTASPVVVGIDATLASRGALTWAAAEARAHHAPLVIVHVIDPGPDHGPTSITELERTKARIEEFVDHAAVGGAEQVLEIGVPSRVLIRASRDARMLVLGCNAYHHRFESEFRPVPELGRTARACIARAECPVVIVPEAAATRTVPPDIAEARRRAQVQGARAIFPHQGRVPTAHW